MIFARKQALMRDFVGQTKLRFRFLESDSIQVNPTKSDHFLSCTCAPDVTQAFLPPAGSGDFPVASWPVITGQECPVNSQAGKPALRNSGRIKANQIII